MNKNERLSDIIGQCNDEFIMKANAEATPIAKRRISFVPFAATAACACLVGGGIFAYSQSIKDKNPQSGAASELESSTAIMEWSSIASNEGDTTEETIAQQESMKEDELIAQDETMQSSTDIYQEPQWDDKSFYEQFPCFNFNDIAYVAAGETYADIGEKLGTAMANNVDIYTETAICVELEIYEIISVDTEYAVAVKTTDGFYGVYTNCNYETATLGDMVEGLNLEENLTFDAAYIESPGTFVEVQDVDLEFMWDFLADCYDAESVGDYLAFSDEVFRENSDALNPLVDFSISSDVLGFENLSFSVTQGGYISTNAISTGRAFYIGADKAKELLSYIKIDDNTYVQVPVFDDDNTFTEDTDAEDNDIFFSMSYSPIDDSQSATLIAEFKETMGEAPLNLTTEQANSILQKISGLVLCKVDDASEIEFPDGGGIVFEIEGGHRYNFIGENILLFDDAYFSIESDATELIRELTSLLSGASSESNAESDDEITTETNAEGNAEYASGVSTLVVAAYELNGAYANEVEIPDDAQIYELQLVDADASEAPANPNHHSVIEVWYETDRSDKISYSFLGDSIVKIGDEYYRDLSGNADILKQAIADSIQSKQDYRHFEVVEFQKYDSESTS